LRMAASSSIFRPGVLPLLHPAGRKEHMRIPVPFAPDTASFWYITAFFLVFSKAIEDSLPYRAQHHPRRSRRTYSLSFEDDFVLLTRSPQRGRTRQRSLLQRSERLLPFLWRGGLFFPFYGSCSNCSESSGDRCDSFPPSKARFFLDHEKILSFFFRR